MRKPPSIDAIYDELFESLALYPQGTDRGIQPEEVFGAGSLDDQPPSKSTSRLIGIVFCRPGSKYADEIIKDLRYLEKEMNPALKHRKRPRIPS